MDSTFRCVIFFLKECKRAKDCATEFTRLPTIDTYRMQNSHLPTQNWNQISDFFFHNKSFYFRVAIIVKFHWQQN